MTALTYKNMSYEINGENFLVMLNAMIASTDLSRNVRKLEVDFYDPYLYSADLVHKWFTALIRHYNVRVVGRRTEGEGQSVRMITGESQPFQNDFDRAYAVVRLGCELYPYLLMASVSSELKTVEVPGELLLRFVRVLDEVYERRPRVRALLELAQAVLAQDNHNIGPVNRLDAFPM